MNDFTKNSGSKRKAARLRIAALVLYQAVVIAGTVFATHIISASTTKHEKPPLVLSTKVVPPEAWLNEKAPVSEALAIATWDRYSIGYEGGLEDYLEKYVLHENIADRREMIVCGWMERIGGHEAGWRSAQSQIAALEKHYSRQEIVEYISHIHLPR